MRRYRCGGGGELLNGIGASVQAENIIRNHMFHIWKGHLSDNGRDFLSGSEYRLSECVLLPDLETLVVSGAGAER